MSQGSVLSTLSGEAALQSDSNNSFVIDLDTLVTQQSTYGSSSDSDSGKGDSPGELVRESRYIREKVAAESSRSYIGIHYKTARKRQAALDKLMKNLNGEDGPIYYTFPSLVNYLANGSTAFVNGEFFDTLNQAAQKILSIAGAPVYLADGKAFIADVLIDEFPELIVFQLQVSEAFVESKVHPGLWVETQKFANLRSLSRMRRELKGLNLTNKEKITKMVKVLLGFEPPK